MVKEGCGIACLPDYSVKGALDAGDLRTVLDNYVTHLTNFVFSGRVRGR